MSSKRIGILATAAIATLLFGLMYVTYALHCSAFLCAAIEPSETEHGVEFSVGEVAFAIPEKYLASVTPCDGSDPPHCLGALLHFSPTIFPSIKPPAGAASGEAEDMLVTLQTENLVQLSLDSAIGDLSVLGERLTPQRSTLLVKGRQFELARDVGSEEVLLVPTQPEPGVRQSWIIAVDRDDRAIGAAVHCFRLVDTAGTPDNCQLSIHIVRDIYATAGVPRRDLANRAQIETSVREIISAFVKSK